MNTLSYKTVSANKRTVTKNWLLINAEGKILGRLASRIAFLLRGKHKTNFTPHVDCGDNVVVINTEKIIFSGNKYKNKEYVSYTGFPGGQRFTRLKEILAKQPQKVLESAIRGMLPKNKLGRQLFRNLYVYAGSEHKQEAQGCKAMNIDKVK